MLIAPGGIENDLILAKFAQSTEFSEEAFNKATTMLEDLTGLIVQPEYSNVPTEIVPEDVSFVPTEFTGVSPGLTLALTPFNKPELKVSPDAEITPVTPEEVSGTVPNAPILPEVPVPSTLTPPSFDFDKNIPVIDITDLINTATSIFGQLQDSLDTVGVTLLSHITNPQQAIGDAMVESMTEAAVQKILDGYQPKYLEAQAFFSSRGWNMPQGVVGARVAELNRQQAQDESSVRRDLTIKNFELSQQNFQIAMQTYIQYTQANNALCSSVLEKVALSTKHAAELVISRFNAYVALYNTDVSVFKAELDYNTQEVLSRIEINKAYITQYTAEVQAYATKVGAIAAYNDNLIKIQGGEIAVYTAKTQSDSAYNNVMLQNYTAEISRYSTELSANLSYYSENIKKYLAEVSVYDTVAKQNIASADIKLKNESAAVAAFGQSAQLAISQADINMKAYQAAVALLAEIAKASANIASQLAASSLSAVSAGVSMSNNGSTSWDATKDEVETRINLSGSVSE